SRACADWSACTAAPRSASAPSKTGKPCPRFTAPVRWARALNSEKTVGASVLTRSEARTPGAEFSADTVGTRLAPVLTAQGRSSTSFLFHHGPHRTPARPGGAAARLARAGVLGGAQGELSRGLRKRERRGHRAEVRAGQGRAAGAGYPPHLRAGRRGPKGRLPPRPERLLPARARLHSRGDGGALRRGLGGAGLRRLPWPARPATRAAEDWLLRRRRAGHPQGADGARRSARERRGAGGPGGPVGGGQRPEVGGDPLRLSEEARAFGAQGGPLRAGAPPRGVVAGRLLPSPARAADLPRPPHPRAEDEPQQAPHPRLRDPRGVRHRRPSAARALAMADRAPGGGAAPAGGPARRPGRGALPRCPGGAPRGGGRGGGAGHLDGRAAQARAGPVAPGGGGVAGDGPGALPGPRRGSGGLAPGGGMSDVHERLRRLLFVVPYVARHRGVTV